MPSYFFFHEPQLITVLLLTWDSYMSWSTRFASLKLSVGFCIFDFWFSFLLKLIFLFNKMHFDSLALKRSNSFQNQNGRKATHSFIPRRPSFKLQQDVWNLMISVWVGTPPKTDLVTNLLNLENRSFEKVNFSLNS